MSKLSQAYTPALLFSESSLIRRRRELPIKGQVVVKLGQRVKFSDKVLKAYLPGDLEILRLADLMDLDPLAVKDSLLVKLNDKVLKGQLVAEAKHFFGLFKTSFKSPLEGTVEFFSEINAHIGIRRPPVPLEVDAYISGEIVSIEDNRAVEIEERVSFFQGIFGVGSESSGEIYCLDSELDRKVKADDLEKIKDNLKNKILIGGSSFSDEALLAAAALGIKGVITGSIDANTLRNYIKKDLGVSVTGDEEVSFPLIITEGFGDLALSERVYSLAKKSHGSFASINGQTQIRAGATRPEIIIFSNNLNKNSSDESSRTLRVGTKIRIIRTPHFGKIAEVLELPEERRKLETGAMVRVLKAKILETNVLVTVPRANVELV